jgi:hypothetical protein
MKALPKMEIVVAPLILYRTTNLEYVQLGQKIATPQAFVHLQSP